MKRRDFIHSVKHVVETLERSGLPRTVRELMDHGARETRRDQPIVDTKLLRAFNEYAIGARDYTSSDRQVATILGLSDIEDPDKWAIWITASDDPARLGTVYTLYRTIANAIEVIPKVLALISPPYYELEDLGQDQLSTKQGFEGKAFLSVSLADSPGDTLTRIVKLLSSVDQLYQACATIRRDTTPIVLFGCDSGSDKAFDFLGAAKVIQMVKEILTTVWDRIVFYREAKFDQRLDLVAKSLPVIDEITRMEKTKKLSKEEAEILRTQILTSLKGFMSSGAYTPEMQERSSVNVQELVTPTIKLLPEQGTPDTPSPSPRKKGK